MPYKTPLSYSHAIRQEYSHSSTVMASKAASMLASVLSPATLNSLLFFLQNGCHFGSFPVELDNASVLRINKQLINNNMHARGEVQAAASALAEVLSLSVDLYNAVIINAPYDECASKVKQLYKAIARSNLFKEIALQASYQAAQTALLSKFINSGVNVNMSKKLEKRFVEEELEEMNNTRIAAGLHDINIKGRIVPIPSAPLQEDVYGEIQNSYALNDYTKQKYLNTTRSILDLSTSDKESASKSTSSTLSLTSKVDSALQNQTSSMIDAGAKDGKKMIKAMKANIDNHGDIIFDVKSKDKIE